MEWSYVKGGSLRVPATHMKEVRAAGSLFNLVQPECMTGTLVHDPRASTGAPLGHPCRAAGPRADGMWSCYSYDINDGKPVLQRL